VGQVAQVGRAAAGAVVLALTFTPPPLDHDGIDDGVVEKGSSVWYWYRGRWLELTGSN
jgi:hypothetical protein